MRESIIGLAAVAALFALPNVASATDAGAAAGATTGAVAGAIVGGPVGAVIGAGVGGVVGGAATGPNPPTTGSVVVEERVPAPATREQTCVQDAMGNRTCREVIR
jgi:phage tail tape-measure protein